MRHIRRFDEAASAGRFSEVTWPMPDERIQIVPMGKLQRAADEVAAAFPDGWTPTVTKGMLVGPGSRPARTTVRHMSRYEYATVPLTDRTLWAAKPRHKGIGMDMVMSMGVPEGARLGEDVSTRYADKTLRIAEETILGMVARGWSGTRWELNKSREVSEMFDKLPNRKRYNYFSKYLIVLEVVKVGLASGRLRETRRNAIRVISAGPNFGATDLRKRTEFPAVRLHVIFLDDDWVYLRMTRIAEGGIPQYISTSWYMCDGIRGLTAAIRSYMDQDKGD